MSLFRRAESRAISTDAFSDTAAGFRSLTGDAQGRALRLVPVFSAVSLIADAVASLPIHQYRTVGDRRERVDTAGFFDPVVGTRLDWVHRAMVSLLLRGNAYGFVTFGRGGAPDSVTWLHPDDVTVDETGVFPEYLVRGQRVSRDRIVHVAGFSRPGHWEALSPIRQFGETVDLGLYAQLSAKDWYKNGTTPSHSLKNTAQTLNAEQAQAVKERFRASVRTGEPFVHGVDWDISQIGVSAADAAFLDAIKASATQVAAIYRVPAEKIGGETGSSLTYNTTEQQTIDMIQWTLRPWFTRLEQSFSRLLAPGEFVKFNADALIRTDTKTRHEVHKLALEMGLETQDEARAIEDRPPLTDEQVSEWLTQYRPMVGGRQERQA
jgi:HK97 family phage portal protein